MGKKNNRSIGEKLKRVKTYQTQQILLSDWAKNWRSDQEDVIGKLRYAAMHDNHSEIMHMISQLEGMTEKRFVALNNTLRTISDPDRKLKDLRYESEKLEESIIIEETTSDIINEVEKPEPGKDNSISQEEMVEEIKKSYNAGMSLKEIARWSGINTHKVVKILVTAGVYDSEIYNTIKNMRIEGKTEEEIAYRLGLSKSAMNDYTPYKKGIYNLENPSENALKLREYRNRWKG